MRWPSFFILAYLVFGLQLGLSGTIDIHGAQPDLVLIAVVFIAAGAQRNSAVFGAFLLGAMQDLLISGPWGLRAFAYGLVGIFIISVHELVYSDHILTHFSLALVGSWIVAIVLLLHGWVYQAIHHPANWAHPAAVPLLAGSFYTALVAVPVILLLQRMRRSFGFRPIRARI